MAILNHKFLSKYAVRSKTIITSEKNSKATILPSKNDDVFLAAFSVVAMNVLKQKKRIRALHSSNMIIGRYRSMPGLIELTSVPRCRLGYRLIKKSRMDGDSCDGSEEDFGSIDAVGADAAAEGVEAADDAAEDDEDEEALLG